MPDGSAPIRVPAWLTPALWIVLAAMLLALIVVAAFLLVKMDVFSGGELTDAEARTLWTFLGVSLGVVVTLIGTLLTDQHNRRTSALEHEAQEREALARAAEQARADQEEQRLKLDTVARLLELITEEGKYAPSARVGGAIATMVQLEGGTVALRILGDLWTADAVDSATAVWLVERVLNQDRAEDEQIQAAWLLATHAPKLIPAKEDDDQDWHSWPTLPGTWPSGLPSDVRNSLLVMAVRVLLARELAWWQEHDRHPIDMLFEALADEEFRDAAALVLTTLLELDVLDDFNSMPDAAEAEQIREWGAGYQPAAWFARLLEQLEPWARGDEVQVSPTAPPAPVSPPEPELKMAAEET